MVLLDFTRHLKIIATKLRSIGSDEAYRIERIWQNLRLDLPSLQNIPGGHFADSDPYPNNYPRERGPNVHPSRERMFADALGTLPALNDIFLRVVSASGVIEVRVVALEYLRMMEEVWGQHDGYLTINESCNVTNITPQAPEILCRYIDFVQFIRHILLPNAIATRDWSPERIKQFIEGLKSEKQMPAFHWKYLKEVWRDTRHFIRSGVLSFNIKPKEPTGEAKFFADGVNPIHLNCLTPSDTIKSLHYVIRELALPGWEIIDDHDSKLGLIVIYANRSGRTAFRPTILDHLSALSYFYLPGVRTLPSGLTWRLTECLRYNSSDDYGGHSEWTVVIPPGGLPTAIHGPGNTLKPAFELAGLAFGNDHASLFQE